MKFIILAVFALPLVACTELRGGQNLGPKLKNSLQASSEVKKMPDLNTMAMSGTYPTNPTFVSLSAYSDSSCSGSVIQSTSYLTDVCFVSTTTSEKFACTSNGGTWISYSDTTCTTVASTKSVSPSCSGSGIEMFACGSSSTATALSYPVWDTYTATPECNSEVVQVNGFVNNYCYSTGSNSAAMFSWPNAKIYTTSSCSGTPAVTENLSYLGCVLNDDNTLDDAVIQGSYDQWSYTAPPPTASPTSINGASNSVVVMNLGVLAGLMMAVVQLWKN